MFRNYLKTAVRNLAKNKGFTALNILGLSIGVATCLLITLYITDELGYDKHNVNAKKIYRITEVARLNGHEGAYAGTEKPLLEALKNLPDIEKMTRIIPVNSLFLSPQKFFIHKDGGNIQERNIAYTQSDLADVFTLPLVAGAFALNEPNTAVINETMANKYFNTTNAVGKTLAINDTSLYKVTGVIKDMPAQSHFNYDFLLSYSSLPEYSRDGWGYSGIHNYVMLQEGTDVKKLEGQIQAIEYENYPASMHTNGNYLNIELTPLLNIHLRSTARYELGKTGTIEYVYIFSVIAVFILLIACVNFMNLSTARSASRAKEVGVRKVLGSSRQYLIAQFLTESVLLTLMATVIAVVLVWLAIPAFNELTFKHFSFTAQSVGWIPLLLGVILVVGLLAGSYPAFYLSRFQPIDTLKSRPGTAFKGKSLRSLLVITQFAISIFLIIGTLVIYRQLNYIHNKNLGFNRSQVLVINNTQVLGSQAKIFKQELSQLPGVISSTLSAYLPTGKERKITGMFPQLPLDIKQDVLSEYWAVDEDYIGTLGIQLIAGRNFSAEIASDSTGLIVNEAFVKRFGFKDPLNKPIYRNSVGLETFHIIAVMKDFNFASLKDEIAPVALVFQENRGAISAKVKTANIAQLLSQMENKWKALSPNQQFSYSFMDEDFAATYRGEERTSQLSTLFSSLAILIACLGLFGMATYAAEQRYKEIGIRKVLGATVFNITSMLSFDFIKLVLVAFVIASPLAWLVMNKWLEDFAYRAQMQWWMIAVAGISAVLMALATVSFQSIKAALTDPVKNLRSE